MTNHRKTAVATVLAMVLAYAGFATVAVAHPLSDHDPQNPDPIARSFQAPPIEGPGDPDGQNGIAGLVNLPYSFRAVILNNVCVSTPEDVGDQDIACVTNGGAVWDACDSGSHWNLGGSEEGDVPCSWPRDQFDGDMTDAVVPPGYPYDNVQVSIVADNPTLGPIPASVTTNSADGDNLHGEGVGGDGANDGDCQDDEIVITNPTGVGPEEVTIGPGFILACNDGGPGPREIEQGICGTGLIARPNPPGVNADNWGTGDGVWVQALAETSYLSHRNGTDPFVTDFDGDEPDAYWPHPGVQTFAIFLHGPVHGADACPNYSGVDEPITGTVIVEAS